MGIAKGFLLVIVLGVIGAWAVIYGGFADVAASHPHSWLGNWVLDTAMVKSVKRNASFVVPPAALPSPEAGAREFAEMCAFCHSAPGKPDSEAARGMMPPPPDLARTAADWNDAELYWIISNGVKMTGMPAWGPTHSEQELWEMVSFLRLLPKLSPAQYAALTREGGGAGEEHHHH